MALIPDPRDLFKNISDRNINRLFGALGAVMVLAVAACLFFAVIGLQATQANHTLGKANQALAKTHNRDVQRLNTVTTKLYNLDKQLGVVDVILIDYVEDLDAAVHTVCSQVKATCTLRIDAVFPPAKSSKTVTFPPPGQIGGATTTSTSTPSPSTPQRH